MVIFNNSSTQTDVITKVVITQTGATTATINETTPIKWGEQKSFTLAASGYSVVVTDNIYAKEYPASVSISIGATVNLSYNGNNLK